LYPDKEYCQQKAKISASSILNKYVCVKDRTVVSDYFEYSDCLQITVDKVFLLRTSSPYIKETNNESNLLTALAL